MPVSVITEHLAHYIRSKENNRPGSPVHQRIRPGRFVLFHLHHAGEGRDYSCQWIVSGHWRNQYYPSTKSHKPVWILPYVKGPEDKPLKKPRLTVYGVVR